MALIKRYDWKERLSTINKVITLKGLITDWFD